MLHNYFQYSIGRWSILEECFDSGISTLNLLSITRLSGQEDAYKMLVNRKTILITLRKNSEIEKDRIRMKLKFLINYRVLR